LCPFSEIFIVPPQFHGRKPVEVYFDYKNFLSVIPAKAGIYVFSRNKERVWIPAFAGMTTAVHAQEGTEIRVWYLRTDISIMYT